MLLTIGNNSERGGMSSQDLQGPQGTSLLPSQSGHGCMKAACLGPSPINFPEKRGGSHFDDGQ